MEKVKQISLAEWRAEGEELFGKDMNKWKFKCVQCGHVQTLQDFIDHGIDEKEAVTLFFYSCLGRWKKDVGCDWTLGGLFQIHKLVVISEYGKPVPVFEFAKKN
jgi:hypothetical protein